MMCPSSGSSGIIRYFCLQVWWWPPRRAALSGDVESALQAGDNNHTWPPGVSAQWLVGFLEEIWENLRKCWFLPSNIGGSGVKFPFNAGKIDWEWSCIIEFLRITTIKNMKSTNWRLQPAPRVFWRLNCYAHCLDNI